MPRGLIQTTYTDFGGVRFSDLARPLTLRSTTVFPLLSLVRVAVPDAAGTVEAAVSLTFFAQATVRQTNSSNAKMRLFCFFMLT